MEWNGLVGLGPSGYLYLSNPGVNVMVTPFACAKLAIISKATTNIEVNCFFSVKSFLDFWLSYLSNNSIDLVDLKGTSVTETRS